ncbi:FAD-binding oxidoreductase [Bacteriovoracaceae bacterium]|nr:FAD-binding oxidoreductase [Bacteriovoracaceae bacterium]
MIKTYIPKSLDQLKVHLVAQDPSFFYSSQTSTVVPYDFLQEHLEGKSLTLVNLAALPKEIQINSEKQSVSITGPVTWKELRQELNSKSFDIKTSPTEELACVLAGLATSCTGERCFHYGNLRSQVIDCVFLNRNGEEVFLSQDKPITNLFQHDLLNQYEKEFNHYREFKNAPFPRLKNETDLMIGTEGQLGVITQATLSICPRQEVKHLFIKLPRWEENFEGHSEIYDRIQSFRQHTLICELTDANSTEFIDQDLNPAPGQDLIFFEVLEHKLEDFYENFLTSLKNIKEEDIFEISAEKFHRLRAEVPRSIFEMNSKMKVKKMGTDVQVSPSNFKYLMQIYKQFTQSGLNYNLFGHFGDGHLHYNFMPKESEQKQALELLENMYLDLKNKNASPFAEHGIGLLKKKYIQHFWKETQVKIFASLKNNFDPMNQFFPLGYMNIKKI